MAQVANSFESQKSVTSICGTHHMCNFGSKHKKESYYEIANKGDFKYLLWCLNTTKQKDAVFRVADNCIPHIKAALRIREAGGLWCQKITIGANGTKIVQYETENGLKGPEIKYTRCQQCNHEIVDDNKTILCYLCNKTY